jgi:hypothetical protein
LICFEILTKSHSHSKISAGGFPNHDMPQIRPTYLRILVFDPNILILTSSSIPISRPGLLPVVWMIC